MGYDDRMRGLKTIDQVHVLSGKRIGYDDRMRGFKTIDQVHILPGEERIG